MSKFFRIDDVSLNTDPAKFAAMVSDLRSRFQSCKIMAAVSPCFHTKVGERVFPSMLKLQSGATAFYQPDKVGIPWEMMGLVDEVAAHGIVHADHQLMGLAAQELSILLSCSLTRCKTFVPPFNHHNDQTSEACIKHGIKLIRWHDRMIHLKFHKVTPDQDYYYFHTHDFPTMEAFKEQIA